MTKVRVTELVAIADLKDHPKNYRTHPDDQVSHLAHSLREYGFYRNVVIARDGTILAGHGIVTAAKREGLSEVPAVRLDVDPDDPKALKVLTGDNELARLAEIDDRLLSDLLKEIESTDSLIGTGYDEAMLANLVYVTRTEHEIPSVDHAAEWAGMPEYDVAGSALRVIVLLDNEEDRTRFLSEIGATVFGRKERNTWSVRWPPREKEDVRSVLIEPE